MKKISIFDVNRVDFFLGGKKIVESLNEAKEYGGVTKIDNVCYSNIPNGDDIAIFDMNKLSLFVPSTLDVNNYSSNQYYVKKVAKLIENRFKKKSFVENAEGSWYSDNLQQTVIEKITIVSVNLQDVTVEDINYFTFLASYIKKAMKQEAVSVSVNNSLILV